MHRHCRGIFVAIFVALFLSQTVLGAPATNDSISHRIKRVFVIVLENEGFDVTFGPNSKAPFLSQMLTSEGVLLSQYYGTGHVSLDNYVAMLSGQSATPQTRSDCQVFQDFALTGITPDGQAIGTGCVYPPSIKTLPDQLNAGGKTWRGYMEDMGNDPAREAAACGHPSLNSVAHTQAAKLPPPPWPSATSMLRATIPLSIFTPSSIRRIARPMSLI